jgi:hypothetical protein
MRMLFECSRDDVTGDGKEVVMEVVMVVTKIEWVMRAMRIKYMRCGGHVMMSTVMKVMEAKWRWEWAKRVSEESEKRERERERE